MTQPLYWQISLRQLLKKAGKGEAEPVLFAVTVKQIPPEKVKQARACFVFIHKETLHPVGAF
ncbi:hypothetical protein QE443_004128 [Pantoea ananatis]|jgi:hypothetical protein|nr:hypothetical protein [Pantoea ananatis]MDR6091824.1 hypothetical protein [Pantoea ananatis]PWV60881.1 hypothetical protein C7425_11187 [Pantoea ananatis]